MESPPTPGEHVLRIRHDQRERECILYLPKTFDRIRELPLVLLFHGGGGTGRLAMIAGDWHKKADEAGFAIAAPQGVRPDNQRRGTFLRNPQFFNVGSRIGYAEDAGIDDRGFVRTLTGQLLEQLPIDRSRVYSAGFSNGASAAFQTAMDMPDRMAAIAPVAGHLWRREPAPTEPVSMIYIIGTADPLNPMAGGVVTSPWGKRETRPPIARSVETWVEWIGCSGRPSVLWERDGVRSLGYGPSDRGATVEFITIAGAGHVWPGGRDIIAERIAGASTDKLNATDEIWRFFAAHPKTRE